ncbi:hypothetical protein JRO89_XS11G0192300 [Xanthoceras sorbifolium]|uniref:Remorin n=1 Tax=Xanthoceras sorbifolium TaxID=99658 RepID=A0ABQ8HGB0_9ROSI|nr:hypothetical protein JRO89_XS11G0192300 [Xanthoceras sorbifolium]
MAEEEPKKLEAETPPPAPMDEPVEPPKDVAEEKAVVPPPLVEEKPDESKALAIVEKSPEPAEEKKSTESSVNRGIYIYILIIRVATEKRISLIRAWEESEKSKAENKAHKKLSDISSWENSQKASVESEIKKFEMRSSRATKFWRRKKQAYVEKMKNKIALIHKEAEEKRAIIEAKRGEDMLKAEETAAKYRATGTAPKKLLGCF